jgi:ribosomal 50S subunit-associated protein YjgA (DUF615 family)
MSHQSAEKTQRKRPVLTAQKLRTSLRTIQTTNLEKFGITPAFPVVITKKRRRTYRAARDIE